MASSSSTPTAEEDEEQLAQKNGLLAGLGLLDEPLLWTADDEGVGRV